MALKIKRGHGAPSELLKEGEPYLDLDTGEMYIGDGTQNIKYVKDNGTKRIRFLAYSGGGSIVLENTFGEEIIIEDFSVGQIIVRKGTGEPFPSAKTFISVSPVWGDDPSAYGFFNAYNDYYLNKGVIISSFDSSGNPNSDAFIGTPVEIIVYP